MGAQPDPECPLAFGPFEFDQVSAQVRKHGHVLRLPGQSLQILSVMMDRPGQIISRDELRQRLWGPAAFGDFEQGLNSAVNKLRQTLGDSADEPRYIETVPGRGYRFVAPLQRASRRPVLGMTAPVPLRIEPRPKTQWQRRLLVGTGVGLAVVAGAGYWMGKRSQGAPMMPKALTFAVHPPRGFVLEGAASRQAFALSPDGSRLAFTAMDSSGEFSVFLRDFNSVEPRLLGGSNSAHSVFWPHDARTLYFTARGKLWRASLESDAHVFLADSPSFMFSGAWLSSRQMLLDSFRASYLISPSGGPVERLNQIY